METITDAEKDPEKPGTSKFLEVWSEGRQWIEEMQLKKEYYRPYAQVTVLMYTAEREY
jgi:hypothetical protein